MPQDTQALAAVQETVRRFVLSRSGPHGQQDLEDVVQEVMTRLLENRSRLERAAWAPYALVSARNLLLDRDRAGRIRHRHRHRLHAPDLTASAEEQVLTQEEHTAMRRALTTLPPELGDLLEQRYGTDEVPTRSLAPAAAARLARARARLRVAYLLEHTGLALPTHRCRPVLEAVSSADTRRQERLGAARHLSACRVCATYAPVLLGRQRALAALHPLAWVGVAFGSLWGATRRQPVRTTAAVTTAAAVAVAGTLVLAGPADRAVVAAPAGQVATAPSPVPRARSPLPLDGSVPAAGPVQVSDVVVQAVPADEGFWVGDGPGRRLWVRLVGAGESAAAVRAGDRVAFSGRVVPLPPGYVDRAGITAAEGREELRALQVYVEVPRAGLTVRR